MATVCIYFWLAVVLLDAVPVAECCFQVQGSSDGTGESETADESSGTAIGRAVGESGGQEGERAKSVTTATAPPVTAIPQTCGHSRLYFANDSPGAGIVGGVDAAYGQYPWMVRLTRSDYFFCGGSIIDENWILSAGHCTRFMTDINSISAIAGDHKVWEDDQHEVSTKISQIIPHPRFDKKTLDYDFVLLRTTVQFNFSENWYVQKICLPKQCGSSADTSAGCNPNSITQIAGWGSMNSAGSIYADSLQLANIEIHTQELCRRQYGSSKVTESMICAGYVYGVVDSCYGDSGGPMMTFEDGYYKMCGVTSWGHGCGRENALGVYGRVCLVSDWINGVING